MRALHDCASRQSNVLLTTATAQHTGTIGKPIRIANHAAVRASKSGIPTNSFQVRSARRIVGKQSLEFRQRPREWKRCTLKDVRRHIPPSMAWIFQDGLIAFIACFAVEPFDRCVRHRCAAGDFLDPGGRHILGNRPLKTVDPSRPYLGLRRRHRTVATGLRLIEKLCARAEPIHSPSPRGRMRTAESVQRPSSVSI
jgi:hypothetical protein